VTVTAPDFRGYQADQPPRAVIYSRISDDTVGDEHGVTNQLGECRRTAEARGARVVAELSDNDIGASNGALRPDYQRLMAGPPAASST
jgi:site-specific DNA recombinase